jgi:outer membrane protein assembly factor BamA
MSPPGSAASENRDVKTLVLLVALAAAAPARAQQSEVLVDIRVHGNTATPDQEVRRLAGIETGAPLTPATPGEVAARLRATGRFRDVEVLKRFASIADPSLILLVIVVDEGAVAIEPTDNGQGPARVVRRRWPRILIFPILGAEDGYGVRYGVQLGLANTLGADSRVSFPLTWGGEKHAGAEFDKMFDRGPIGRLTGGVSLTRRTNPFAGAHDDRRRASIRAERQLAPAIRVGAMVGRQWVTFAEADDRFTQVRADITLDTRLDAVLPRNAVHLQAGVERLSFTAAPSATRTVVDARGYVGMFGQTVLAVRGLRDGANRALPLYMKPLLGGMNNLRGFHAGARAGDTLAAASVELLVPLTSPLSVGRFGISAFVDAGAAYDHGEHLADQPLMRSAGGTVWLSATFVRISLAVARGIGATTRVHAGGSVLF